MKIDGEIKDGKKLKMSRGQGMRVQFQVQEENCQWQGLGKLLPLSTQFCHPPLSPGPTSWD